MIYRKKLLALEKKGITPMFTRSEYLELLKKQRSILQQMKSSLEHASELKQLEIEQNLKGSK